MNEQELRENLREDLCEQFRIARRVEFFSTAQIGARVRYSHSTAIFRYVGRRNNAANSPIYIESKTGNRLDVDAADVTLI